MCRYFALIAFGRQLGNTNQHPKQRWNIPALKLALGLSEVALRDIKQMRDSRPGVLCIRHTKNITGGLKPKKICTLGTQTIF